MVQAGRAQSPRELLKRWLIGDTRDKEDVEIETEDLVSDGKKEDKAEVEVNEEESEPKGSSNGDTAVEETEDDEEVQSIAQVCFHL